MELKTTIVGRPLTPVAIIFRPSGAGFYFRHYNWRYSIGAGRIDEPLLKTAAILFISRNAYCAPPAGSGCKSLLKLPGRRPRIAFCAAIIACGSVVADGGVTPTIA